MELFEFSDNWRVTRARRGPATPIDPRSSVSRHKVREAFLKPLARRGATLGANRDEKRILRDSEAYGKEVRESFKVYSLIFSLDVLSLSLSLSLLLSDVEHESLWTVSLLN